MMNCAPTSASPLGGRNKSSRNTINLASFNLTKAVSIILIIVFHTFGRYDHTQSTVLTLFSYLYVCFGTGILTVFFLITGLGLKKSAPGKLLKKTASNLLMPYLYVTAAYAFLYPVIHYLVSGSAQAAIMNTARYVAAFLLGYARYGNVVFGHMIYWCTATWYLLATFWAINILNLILHIKNKFTQLATVLLCAMVGNYLFSIEFFYFSIAQGLRAVGYLYLGYMLYQTENLLRLKNNFWTYIALIPVFLLQMKFTLLDNTVFVNVVLEYFGSIGTALLLLFVTMFISDRNWKCIDSIKTVGVYSYWVIAVHCAEMDVLPWYLLPQHFSSNHLLAFVIELVLKACIISLSCVLLKKITKLKYKRKLSRLKRG